MPLLLSTPWLIALGAAVLVCAFVLVRNVRMELADEVEPISSSSRTDESQAAGFVEEPTESTLPMPVILAAASAFYGDEAGKKKYTVRRSQ